MAAAAGQAAGLAVGAAVGAVIGGPAGAIAGASIGSAGVGFFEETQMGNIQGTIDQAALDLNRAQARTKAAETAAIHAANFRQALASQISLASMRGGSGSLVSQFGQEAFENFLRDQRAIEVGLQVSEAQGSISQAGLSADKARRELVAATRFAKTAIDGVNLNLTRKRSG